MGWMIDRWDVVLALVAGYVAVMTLVRLMARRRDQDIAEVQKQLDSLRDPNKKKPRSRNRDAA
jgi:uncharacterized membrane-anchored protein YhcB (DUF1043 family)